MVYELGVIPEYQTEAQRIKVLLEKNRPELGAYDLVCVGKSGYILQSKIQKPMAGNDWVMFDYDDTLAATTEVKETRLQLYKDYLETRRPGVSDQMATDIIELTDKFSRWEQKTGEGKIYHPNAHMVVLQWATNEIAKGQEIAETINFVRSTLDRIKQQLTAGQKPDLSDPFYFDQKEKKFTLRGADKMWSSQIEQIFVQSMINPPLYGETLEAASQIGSPRTSIHRTNVGIFTYGDPYYQLLKVFELQKKQTTLPISQIWLTRVPKGDFIVDAVNQGSESFFEQDYIPEDLRDYPDEGLSFGSGHILGQTEHVIVMLDDSPKELASILKANKFLQEHTKASFVCVRSKRDHTKELKKDWEVTSPYGILDFTSRAYLSNDIESVFLVNRYMNLRLRPGDRHPNVINLFDELTSRGIILHKSEN